MLTRDSLKWYLVGGIPTPLKNMSSSVGMMTFPIYVKIKNVPNHKSDIHWLLLVIACEGTRWYYRGTPLKNQVSQAWKSRAQSPSYPGHIFFATLQSFILKPKDPHPGEGSTETPRISAPNKCRWKWHRHAEAMYRWTNTPVVSKRHIPSVPMKPPVRWPGSQ